MISPISLALTLATLYDVLIKLSYKCQDTPLHHAIPCPLSPINIQKWSIPISWNNLEPILPHDTPSSSVYLPSATSTIFFLLKLFFSDLMHEVWEQSLLKLCCWLFTGCFHSPCHTASNIQSSVTHSLFLWRIEYLRVKSHRHIQFYIRQKFVDALDVHKLCWRREWAAWNTYDGPFYVKLHIIV